MKRAGLVILAVFVGVNVLAALLDALAPSPSGPRSSSFATRPEGLAAWAELAKRNGVEVRALVSRAAPAYLYLVIDYGDDRQEKSLGTFCDLPASVPFEVFEFSCVNRDSATVTASLRALAPSKLPKGWTCDDHFPDIPLARDARTPRRPCQAGGDSNSSAQELKMRRIPPVNLKGTVRCSPLSAGS